MNKKIPMNPQMMMKLFLSFMITIFVSSFLLIDKRQNQESLQRDIGIPLGPIVWASSGNSFSSHPPEG